jgi:3-phosphoshikimate 1-carboxyvinyltransferase
MAFSSACSEPVTIKVNDPVSKPYTDLTLQLLEKFGYSFSREGYTAYTLLPVSSSKEVISCRVEGDWSHAAFWLVAGAIAGDIELNGLNLNSCQGDKVILDIMRKAGIILQISDDKILVERCLNIKAFELDATDHPDLFPPLAVLAAAANGRSAIQGVSRLIYKESNRADLIIRLLTALGIRSEVKDDILFIEGGIIRGGVVETAHDHRMVMAASVAGLAASGPVTVRHAGAVSKSYPDFFEDLRSLGAVVSLNPETFLA